MKFLPRFFLIVIALSVAGSLSRLAADDTIYTKVDENPVPIKTPPPKYPLSLKREGVSGVVAIQIVIDEKGAVVTSTVVKSSNPEFEKPALDAVKSWTFKPAKKDGTVVKVRVTIPLRFNVEE